MLTLKAQQLACALDALRADRIAGWAERPLTAIDELIWRTLYFTFMNRKTGACWPSLETLAKHAGCCRRTACTSIKRLRKAGWLKWCRRRLRLPKGRWTQASNEYELMIPRRWRRSVSECRACARTTRLFIHIGAAHLMRPKKGTESPRKIQPTEVPPGFGSNSELLASIDDPDLRESARRCLLIAAQG
jgi:hypothetical protein